MFPDDTIKTEIRIIAPAPIATSLCGDWSYRGHTTASSLRHIATNCVLLTYAAIARRSWSARPHGLTSQVCNHGTKWSPLKNFTQFVV
jgi:hypothetical protein